MTKVKLITGYVPIPNHPRTAADYGKLGENFQGITAAPIKAFYTQLQDCWMARALDKKKYTHFEGDNPQKNSLAYHIVQHQKTEWLLAAALADRQPEVFVWLDYGIFHQPGVTVAVIEDFVKRVDPYTLAIPGCWPVNYNEFREDCPNWRFCGSMLVVPRQFVYRLHKNVKDIAMREIKRTKNVTWEVNTWARVEAANQLPIKWYQANHDETMFTNYPDGVRHEHGTL